MATSDDLAGGGGGGDGGSGGVTDMDMTLALTGASPAQGPTTGNIDVTLSGNGFVTGTTVTISGQPATVKSVNQSQVVVNLPPRPGVKGAVTVVVTDPGGKTVMSASIFGYYYGTIAFDPAAKTPVGGAPYNVAITELENNLKADIVATDNSPTGQLLVMSGNGNGTFLPGRQVRCRQLRIWPQGARLERRYLQRHCGHQCDQHPVGHLAACQQQDWHVPVEHPTPLATFPSASICET